jgi:hypothetical protein
MEYTSLWSKTKYIEEIEDIPPLSPSCITYVQQLGGTPIYYARASYPLLFIPVNVLASEQTKATAETADKIVNLLNYYTTHLESKLRYHASNMILNIRSDASYISERKAKIRASGLFYMGSNIDTANRLANGAILIISTVAQHWKKWDILNQQHHCKQTTQHQHAIVMAQ